MIDHFKNLASGFQTTPGQGFHLHKKSRLQDITFPEALFGALHTAHNRGYGKRTATSSVRLAPRSLINLSCLNAFKGNFKSEFHSRSVSLKAY